MPIAMPVKPCPQHCCGPYLACVCIGTRQAAAGKWEPIASREDAAIVAAMAREAREDAQLIEGAGLSLAEARAMFDGEGKIN